MSEIRAGGHRMGDHGWELAGTKPAKAEKPADAASPEAKTPTMRKPTRKKAVAKKALVPRKKR